MNALRIVTILTLCGIFFLSIMALEFIFQALTGVLGMGFFRIVFLCLLGAGFMTALHLCLPGRIAYIVSLSLLIFISLLAIAQLIYYKVFQSFFTVYSMTNGTGAFQFKDTILTAFAQNIPGILLLALPAATFAFLPKLKLYPLVEPIAFLRMLAPLLAVLSIHAALFVPLARDSSSAYAKSMGQTNIQDSVSHIGLFGTMQLDVLSQFVGSSHTAALKNPTPNPGLATPLPTAKPTQTPADTQTPSNETPEPTLEPTPPPWLGQYNQLPIDFDALMERDKGDKRLTQLHQYFAAQPSSPQNEHTGMFAGYNLIFLTCESFSHLAIDPELTPTLYKMQTEGIQFTNFYNPAWGVSTTDGEYVACTGLVPKSGIWSFANSAKNHLPFALGNQLGALGYQTLAYHNHSYDYYRRDISHPNMGYDYKGLGKGLDVRKSWPESDLEMMEKTLDEVLASEPFHAYYMTVSGHMNYTFTGNFIANKNKEAVSHLPYSNNVRAYLATQLELEYALAYLTKRLEEAGVAERTLIVMVADHYPYGLTVAEQSELAGRDLDEAFGIYESAFIIYAKGMTPERIDAPTSTIDIIPTISNLMGLPYDSRLLSGRDVFSDALPLVYFTNRSFITDAGRYSAKTRSFTPNDGVTIPEGYREAVSAIIDARFSAAAKILELDYFGKLREYLQP